MHMRSYRFVFDCECMCMCVCVCVCVHAHACACASVIKQAHVRASRVQSMLVNHMADVDFDDIGADFLRK